MSNRQKVRQKDGMQPARLSGVFTPPNSLIFLLICGAGTVLPAIIPFLTGFAGNALRGKGGNTEPPLLPKVLARLLL